MSDYILAEGFAIEGVMSGFKSTGGLEEHPYLKLWKCVSQTFIVSAENLVSCLCHQVIYFIVLSSPYISLEYLLV